MALSTLKLLPVAEPEPVGRETSVAAPDKTAHPDLSNGAQALIEAYRLHGYCQASINPLRRSSHESPLVAELDPRAYGLAFDESASYLIHLGGAARTLTLPELIGHLRASYCGSIFLESAHVRASAQRQWRHAQMGGRTASSTSTGRDSLNIFAKLSRVDCFW